LLVIFLYEFKQVHSAEQSEKKEGIWDSHGKWSHYSALVYQISLRWHNIANWASWAPTNIMFGCATQEHRGSGPSGKRSYHYMHADELGMHRTTVSRQLRETGKVKKLDSW